MADVLNNLFRTLMFFIDNVVYGLIPHIYKLFVYLAELNLYSTNEDNPLHILVSRVYVLLGIFMLFKVSFSLLQFMVNPESFTDSNKGMGKLITNVLVVLVLLVGTPWIFTTAMNIQKVVVEENVIGELVLGESMSDGDSGDTALIDKIDTLATDVQFMMYGAFYSINPKVMESGRLLEACNGTSGVLGSKDMATEACLNALQDGFDGEEAASSNNVNLYSFFKYSNGTSLVNEGISCPGGICDDRNFAHLDKLLWWKDQGDYVVNYLPFVSTAAGIFVVLLLIAFCIDIAVRAIKLCFLQMLAPIAIVSYIDPKESIDKSKLRNWGKETASTYFSLFLRLAVIFFVILLISVISSTVLADGGYIEGLPDDIIYNIWIYLFLILGAFMFAKKVPQIIEKIFGMRGTGELSLNPFKTFGGARDSGFGALAGGAIGLGVGAAASGAAAFSASRDEGASLGNSFRRGVGGFGAGAVRGGFTGFKSGGKGTISKSLDVAGIAGRNAALKTNTTLVQRTKAYGRQAIGMQSKREGLDKQIGYHKAIKGHSSNMESRARDQLGKKSEQWKWAEQQRATLQEAVKKGGELKYSFTDSNGQKADVMLKPNDVNYREAFNQQMEMLRKDQDRMIADYINNSGKTSYMPNGGEVDYQIETEKDSFRRDIIDNKLNYMDDDGNNIIKDMNNIQWSEIKDVGGIAEERAYKIENSEDYQDAKILEDSLKSENRQSFWSKQ